MDSPEELLLETHGRRYAAMVWGPEDGEPVLALHGWMDNAASFAALAPLLESWRVVAVDLPGHGRSDPLPDGVWYHYIDHVWDLHAVLDALGWQRANLLGHSMGGALACIYAGTLPERVQRLVAIDSLGPIWDEPERFPGRLREGLEARSAFRSQPRYFETREAAIAARHAEGQLSRKAAATLASRGIERTDRGWTWCVDRRHRLPSVVRLVEGQIQAALSAITAPTLVVGARDSHFRPLRKLIRQRMDALANGRLVELDGGHHLHLETPHAVAEAINAFRRETDSA